MIFVCVFFFVMSDVILKEADFVFFHVFSNKCIEVFRSDDTQKLNELFHFVKDFGPSYF